MLRRLIAEHIAKLGAELAGIQAMAEAELYPPDSLGQSRLELTIAIWELKIAIWLALLPGEAEKRQ